MTTNVMSRLVGVAASLFLLPSTAGAVTSGPGSSATTEAAVTYAKDVAPYLLGSRSGIDLPSISRDAYFVPEQKPIDDLLNDFKEKKTSLAIVVDEWGGTSGLVTLEDIVEEVTGEIRDPFDIEKTPIEINSDGSFIADGKISIYDLEEEIEGMHFPEQRDYDTLGGLILDKLEDIPAEGEKIMFTGIPDFAPEILRRVRLGDPLKAKHLQRALESLAEEGVTQVFRPMLGSDWIVGVVGTLQLDVLKERLAAEYNLEVDFEPTQYVTARWVSGANDNLKKFIEANRASLGEDRDKTPVYLARNAWDLDRAQSDYKEIKFSEVRERGR